MSALYSGLNNHSLSVILSNENGVSCKSCQFSLHLTQWHPELPLETASVVLSAAEVLSATSHFITQKVLQYIVRSQSVIQWTVLIALSKAFLGETFFFFFNCKWWWRIQLWTRFSAFATSTVRLCLALGKQCRLAWGYTPEALPWHPPAVTLCPHLYSPRTAASSHLTLIQDAGPSSQCTGSC